MSAFTEVVMRGGKPIYGDAELSGDYVSSAFLGLYGLMLSSEVTLHNVPRSEVMIQFLDILSELNVEVKWLTTGSVFLENKGLKNDLTYVKGKVNARHVTMLIPFVLAKTRACVVPSEYRHENRLYRELGFVLDTSSKDVTIKTPLSFSVNRKLDVRDTGGTQIVSRLLLQMIVPTLEVIYNTKDLRFAEYNIDREIKLEKVEFTASNNQHELALYTSLGALSVNEVRLTGVRLTQALGYLLTLASIGVRYDVEGEIVRIWRDHFEFKEDYDWSERTIDELAFLMVLVTLYARKPVRLMVRTFKDLEEVIKELNIIGCRLTYSKGDGRGVIIVKPGDVSPVKVTAPAHSWSGVFLFAAVLTLGTSIIKNADEVERYYPLFTQNMRSLHIDIRTR